MSESGPLDINYDVSGTKTAVPIITDGHIVEFRLGKLTLERTEKGPSTKWEYDLVNPAPDTEGGQILPGGMGAKQFENIQLYAKADAKDRAWFVKKIATRMDALLGTGDPDNKKGKPARPQFFVMPVNPNDPQLNPETVAALIGKTMVVKMKIKTGDYVGNEFGTVTFPGDIAA